MLRQRVIFTLVYDGGMFNQSRNFRLQKVGNIDWLENNYKFRDIAFSLDELVVLNVSRGGDKDLAKFAEVLSRVVEDVFIPVAAGGGLTSIDNVKLMFDSGADKVVVNTALHNDRSFIESIVQHYGKQSIVASVDYNSKGVFINNGTERLGMSLQEYVLYVESLGVGEIYLNSIEKDGTGFGYDLKVAAEVAKNISTPLIIAGGAGNEKHLIEGLSTEGINAVATANLFNFMGNGLPNARKKILSSGGNLAQWI